ncbi:hypothetical protein [Caulobacter sp. NIBR2454]|nr:hypothetical protein [Caulobacter sp. NIBR2454]
MNTLLQKLGLDPLLVSDAVADFTTVSLFALAAVAIAQLAA